MYASGPHNQAAKYVGAVYECVVSELSSRARQRGSSIHYLSLSVSDEGSDIVCGATY